MRKIKKILGAVLLSAMIISTTGNMMVYANNSGDTTYTFSFSTGQKYTSAREKQDTSKLYMKCNRVYHSHDYTCMQQFHRNFDLGVSQGEHPEIFKDVPSATEGTKMVKSTAKIFLKEMSFGTLFYFCLQCAYKYAGYLLGKNYQKLPTWLVLRCTTSPGYFKQCLFGFRKEK